MSHKLLLVFKTDQVLLQAQFSLRLLSFISYSAHEPSKFIPIVGDKMSQGIRAREGRFSSGNQEDSFWIRQGQVSY